MRAPDVHFLFTSVTASQWLGRGFLLLLLLACSLALLPAGADPDLWGHVQYGLDAWQEGLPQTTTYSYTAHGYRWINHEHLSEMVLAFLARMAGGPALQIFRWTLAIGVLGLIMGRLQQAQAALLTRAVLLTLVTLNLVYHWAIRPQLFSYFLFALLLWIECRISSAPSVDAGRRASRSASWLGLWVVVPLLAAWSNLHGGFLAGLAVFQVLVGLHALQVLWQGDRPRRRSLAGLAALAVAGLVATGLNPYGFQLHQWLIESLRQPRPEIVEWHGLSWQNPQAWLLAPLLCMAVAAWAADRTRLPWRHVIVLLLVGVQAILHQRHIAFFALACGFFLPASLDGLLRRWGCSSPDTDPPGPARSRAAYLGGTALVAAACIALMTGIGLRLANLPIPRNEYPVGAVQFMAAHDLRGRLVVTYNWAQYLIAALGASSAEQGIVVACDGRFRTCYPQDVLDMHFDFVLGDLPGKRFRGKGSPPFDPTRVLRHGQPDLVLIDRRQRPAVRVMQEQAAGWSLLYQDQIAQLWGRTTRYDDPASGCFLPRPQRQVSDTPQRGSVAWPALPADRGPMTHLVGQRSRAE